MSDSPNVIISLTLELEAGLEPREALRRAREAVRFGDLGARQAAFYLADLVRGRRYLALGATSPADLARQIGKSKTQFYELVRVGKALPDSPFIDDEFEQGRLTWTHVQAITRVATPETERAWAEWAAQRTTDETERQVKRCERGDLPTDPSKQRIHTPRIEVGGRLTPEEWVVYQRGRAKMEAELGRSVSDREMLLAAACHVLETRPDGTTPGRTVVNDAESLIHVHVGDGGEASVVGTDAEEHVVDPEALRRAASSSLRAQIAVREALRSPEANPGPKVCSGLAEGATRSPDGSRSPGDEAESRAGRGDVADARPARPGSDALPVQGVSDAGASGGETPAGASGQDRDRDGGRVTSPGASGPGSEVDGRIDAANHGRRVPEHLRARPTSARLRKYVLRRDRLRCRKCGGRRNVTVHHMHWRSYGGPTHEANLLALCERCHSSVHARFLLLLGPDVHDVRFVDPTGRPVERPEPSAPVRFRRTDRDGEGSPARTGGVVELRDVPEVVGVDWWARHRHLFHWDGRGGELSFVAGRPVEPPPRSTGAQARDRADGATPGEQDPGEGGVGGIGDRASGGLDDLQGQVRLRARLAIALEAARRRGEPLKHLLFTGPPGLGKTRLATAVAAELGTPLVRMMAPTVRGPELLLRTLTNLAPGSVLFLDELHSLPLKAAEVLYEALDEGTITLTARAGVEQRTFQVRLAPFTLIGATTDEERVPSPLRSRLQCERLELYRDEEVAALLAERAATQGFELREAAGGRLAAVSRGVPRRALMLLEAARDEATVVGSGVVDLAIVERALERLEVDAEGLTPLDRAYLEELRGGPLGLKTLAARLGVSAVTLREVYEPFLIRRGFVRITSTGRCLRRPR